MIIHIPNRIQELKHRRRQSCHTETASPDDTTTTDPVYQLLR
jgi:hypothetical protein